MKLKLKEAIAYVLTAVFILSMIEQPNVFIKGEMQEADTTMEEVLEEIPDFKNPKATDYIVMTDEEGSLDETIEVVEMTKETAEELQEKFEDIIIEEDIEILANEKRNIQVLHDKKQLIEKMKKGNNSTLRNEKDDVQSKRNAVSMADEKKKKRELSDKWEREESIARKSAKKELEWSVQAINAEDLKTDVKNRKKVKVAVLDSGVDIVTGIDLAETVNLVSEEKEISPMFLDLTGHGTSIASIIAGNSEGSIQGINPNVELYSVKVLNGENKAPLSRIIEGIYWCIENDVKIINMSFGTSVHSYALERAVKDAYEANILMIGAAGNNAGGVEYPAAYDEVMAVAATNTNSEIASFSNTGEELDVAAPGEKIKVAGFFNGNIVTHGTSIAVPHVVGVASLLWEKDLSKSNEFIRQLIDYSSKNISNTNECGLLDAKQAFEVYEIFTQNFEENKLVGENFIPENMESPETFEHINNDDTYVEGRWGLSDHKGTIDPGASANGIKDADLINILKAGVVYPDIDASGWNNEDNIFPEWHGAWNYTHEAGRPNIPVNYISCYELVTRIALKSGNSSTFKGTNKFKVDGLDADVQSWIATSIDTYSVGLQEWKYLLAKYKNGNNATNRKYFLWGCALHILTDTFAHSTKFKNKTTGVTGNDISHPDADKTSICGNRYTVAKKAVSYSMRYLLSDIPGDYYDIYQALKYAPYDNSWAKKKLLDYAKSNGSTMITSGETTYFRNASA